MTVLADFPGPEVELVDRLTLLPTSTDAESPSKHVIPVIPDEGGRSKIFQVVPYSKCILDIWFTLSSSI